MFQELDVSKLAIHPNVSSAVVRRSTTDLLEVEIDDLVSDEQVLRLLVEATNERATAYGDAAKLCLNLPDTQIVILVDFDVLVAYIESETGRDDYAEIRYFFEYSDFRYGIPAGAFEELLNYLSKEKLAGKEANRIKKGLREGNIDVLASRLQEALDSAIDSETDLRSTRTTESYVDDRIVVLDRLIRVLASPRFTKVYSTSDDSLASYIYAAMQDRHSKHSKTRKSHDLREGRSNNNSRDARNLAIVLWPWQQHGDKDLPARHDQASDVCHFVLLTSTSPVIVVARHLRRSGWARCYNIAVRPNQLFIPSLLGAADSHISAQDRASTLGRMYQTATHKLMVLSNDLRRNKKASAATIKQYSEVVEKLRNDRNSQRIEQVRSNCLSLPIFFASQHIHAYGERFIHPRYTSFSRLLERLNAVLCGIDGYQYSLVKVHTASLGYRTYAITSSPLGSIGDDSSEEQIAKIRAFEHPSDDSHYVQVQWEIDVDEMALMECLSDERCPRGNKHVGSNDPRELVAVVSGHRRYVFGANEVAEAGGLRHITLSSLQRMMEKSSDDKFNDDRIEEIEICTPLAKIVFDVVPPEHSWTRRLTVMFESRLLPEFVRHLYEWTGNKVVSTQAFEQSLGQANAHIEEDLS